MVTVSKREALQAFDGVMLSDGGLRSRGNSLFYINLSDNRDYKQRATIPVGELLEFLQHLAGVLVILGVESCRGYPKIVFRANKPQSGEMFPGVNLTTKVSSFLTEQYPRWYTGGKIRNYRVIGAKKIVPLGFQLTPISLAYWFMGDGCSVWSSSPTVYVTLNSQCFSLSDVARLEEQLHSFGFSTGRIDCSKQSENKHISNIRILIYQDSVDHFMDIVSPHVVSPYLYKVKYRGERGEHNSS